MPGPVRRTRLAVFAFLLVVSYAPSLATAQAPAKVYHVGLLGTAEGPTTPSFRQGFRDLGYIEGRNLRITYRWSEGKTERFSALAAELVSLKVDVIVASGPPAAVAAKGATTTIPIVFTVVGDPVGLGLVASLARSRRRLRAAPRPSTCMGIPCSVFTARASWRSPRSPGSRPCTFRRGMWRPVA